MANEGSHRAAAARLVAREREQAERGGEQVGAADAVRDGLRVQRVRREAQRGGERVGAAQAEARHEPGAAADAPCSSAFTAWKPRALPPGSRSRDSRSESTASGRYEPCEEGEESGVPQKSRSRSDAEFVTDGLRSTARWSSKTKPLGRVLR